jgi:multidrug resistance efflux pump
MGLELFEALTAANVPADKARAAANSINKEIDRRYALHSTQLATRGDVEQVRKEIAEGKADLQKQLAAMQNELVKWTIGALFGGMAATTAILKLL